MCSLRLDDRRQRRRNPKLGSFRPERLRERHAREFVPQQRRPPDVGACIPRTGRSLDRLSVGSGFGFQGEPVHRRRQSRQFHFEDHRRGSNGKSRTLAELPGLQIQSVAVDKRDRVYAATAPDGKVYRVDAGGKPEVFYDPKVKYIWSLAFNSQGDLFVATGDGGEIHKVTPDGKGSVFFRTEETHARSLAVDAKDNVIVGTEPGGLIVRISPTGDGFVLHQASKREVTAIAVTDTGVSTPPPSARNPARLAAPPTCPSLLQPSSPRLVVRQVAHPGLGGMQPRSRRLSRRRPRPLLFPVDRICTASARTGFRSGFGPIHRILCMRLALIRQSVRLWARETRATCTASIAIS